MSCKNNEKRVKKKKSERLAFDDDDEPTFASASTSTSSSIPLPKKLSPQESRHWECLVHEEGDALIHSLEELKDRFRSDVVVSAAPGRGKGQSVATTTTTTPIITTGGRNSSPVVQERKTTTGGGLMALWSCVAGYCEALSTHTDPIRRYRLFPLPIDALERLVQTEFRSKILAPAAALALASAELDTSPASNNTVDVNVEAARHQASHRSMVRAVANAVWGSAVNSSKKNEEHANSLYVCLRGHIDHKSIDCLGSSVTTVAGLKLLHEEGKQQHQQEGDSRFLTRITSMLTLSEDHAYERHIIEVEPGTDGGAATVKLEGTCEVAIPGSTKRQKAKRACEIADTFKEKGPKNAAAVLLTPENSWLYMATNPVVCQTTPMSLVPIVANINCNIASSKQQPGKNSTISKKGISVESRQLYQLKRELLWILYDVGAMKSFPFGVMELGDCEQTVGSPRGEEWIQSPLVSHNEAIMRNEELFLEAAQISREQYKDAQVYPYYYAGHYHKDAGEEQVEQEPNHGGGNAIENKNKNSGDNEHRFVDALRMYSEAARVTSSYRFDTGDCLQLNKHLTTVAALIQEDILTSSCLEQQQQQQDRKQQPRQWIHTKNAISTCAWLLRFLDHLLHWEEGSLKAASAAGVTSKNPRFVEVLQGSHKFFVGKLLQTFDARVRMAALEDFFSQQEQQQQEGGSLAPRSKRLESPSCLLAKTLQKSKVNIRDIDLAIIDEDDGDTGRRKRRRRS